MSLTVWIAIIGGALIVWGSVSTTAALLLGAAVRRADRAEQATPPEFLEGWELDARFYGVVSESWQ